MKHSSPPRGFSLIELLTVITIIGIMITFSALSIGSIGARRLSQGGNLVVDLANEARQNSMTKGVMTAFIVAKSSPSTNHKLRSFILMEKGPRQTEWKPVTKWELLPTGTVVDGTASFIQQTPAIGLSNLPKLNNVAMDPSSCAFQVFLPDGRLSVKGITSPEFPVLRVVEALKPVGNYYDVELNILTGTPKVVRP